MNAETFTIEQLQNAVEKLPPEKFTLFRLWFEDFAADQWDALADAALAEHAGGQTRKL